MAEWIDCKNGTSICIHNPVRTAFLIVCLLERERVRRICVDEVFKAVNDILLYQEIIHTKRDEKNFNFPK